jgi:hypothetical protein
MTTLKKWIPKRELAVGRLDGAGSVAAIGGRGGRQQPSVPRGRSRR